MKAAQRDANEAELVKDLRARGFLVQQLMQGDGVPDLIVWGGGRIVLCEVKDPAGRKDQRKLTPAQVRWHAAWSAAPVFVVETVDDVVAIFGGA